MGHEAAVTKKIVLNKVTECVAKANQAIVDVANVIQTHDKFVEFTEQQFTERDARLKTQGEWLLQVEGDLSEAERDILCAFRVVQHRLDAHDQLMVTFRLLPWYRRVWAVLTGQFPEPPESMRVTVNCLPVKLAEKHRVYAGGPA